MSGEWTQGSVGDLHSDDMRTGSGNERELGRADMAVAVVLFVAALALRVPFRSQFAYHWDSAQFALAVGEYNIQISQPHAPGFYWYVMLGRLVNLFVCEPHAALVWLSVVGGAWLSAGGYLLATSMFGRRCGLGTGLILLTSPLCWFHSEIALTTIVDSAAVVSFVFVCWQAMQRGVTWGRTIVMAVLLAAIAGIRQQSAPVLIPLWLYLLWGHARPRARKLLCAAVLVVGISLFWFVPTVRSAGGLAAYVHLLRLKSQFDAPRTVWGGGGVGALLADAYCMGRACWVGLLLAGAVMLAEFVCWLLLEDPTSKGRSWQANRAQLCLLAFWVAPMVLFGVVFMYMAMPGHVLNFFPAVAIFAALGVARFSERVAAWSAVREWVAQYCVWAVVTAGNLVAFLWSLRIVTPLLMGLPLTGVEIREHDAELSACFRTIRQDWPSKNVVVCHRLENFYWGFRQFEYHLPEYQNALLTTDVSLPGILGTMEWVGYGHRTTFEAKVEIPTGEQAILVVPPGGSVEAFKSHFDLRQAALVMDSRLRLYVLQQ